ncbi:hypothetical protein B0H11DRAFT_1922119 [Mycena galericulata]|nr:hypothetical protein B0H11DRAFT_1922119 [Mycena galericulata]
MSLDGPYHSPHTLAASRWTTSSPTAQPTGHSHQHLAPPRPASQRKYTNSIHGNSTPFSVSLPRTSTKRPRMISRANRSAATDENIPPSPSNRPHKRLRADADPLKPRSTRKSPRSDEQKMKDVNFANAVHLVAVRLKHGEGGEQDASDQSEAIRGVKSEGMDMGNNPQDNNRVKKPPRDHSGSEVTDAYECVWSC